jgi:glyoxylase-like metal-dependent hydrolase (beta-lactamase superfamily II)
VKFVVIPVTPYQQNCSLIWCEATGQAALVDPGGETARLLAEIRRRDITLAKILLTHGHLDHVGGARALSRELDVPIIGPQEDDAFLLENLPAQAEMFGFPPTEAFVPTRWLHDGDRVAIGEVTLEVIHCPGHTPGHVVFLNLKERIAFVGDVLFKGSIGRTDFVRGNHAALLHSIRGKLFPLGDDIRFVPGHGPQSTFGHERSSNPFVSDHAFMGSA